MSFTPLDMFIRASDALIKFDAHFSLVREEETDEFELEVRCSEIEKLWIKVQEMFDKCLDFLMSSVDSKKRGYRLR